MNMQQTFYQEIATAALVVKALQDAGIGPDDEDYATLIESECDALERLRRIIRAAKWAEAQGKAARELEVDIKHRRERFEAKAETLREITKQAMTTLDLQKLQSPDFTASLSAGKPGLVIQDETQIPTQLCKTKIEPDRAAIRKSLEQGEAVPGAFLTPATPILTVRTR